MPEKNKYRDALEAILGERTIAYHRIFARIENGGVIVAVFLSQAYYWSGRTKDPEGYFYKSGKEWFEETGLSRSEQETARKRLKQSGILEEKLKGRNPATVHYRINKEILYDIIAEFAGNLQTEKVQFAGNLQTSLQKNSKQVCRKPANLNTEITTETTTETTTYMGAEAAPNISGIFPDDDFDEEKPTQAKEAEGQPNSNSKALENITETLPPPPPAPTPKKGDIVDGILRFSRQPGQVDVSDYPEDVQAIIKAFCETFNLIPPSKGARGSQYQFWIKSGRELQQACAEFGTDLMADIKSAWTFKDLPGHPQAVLYFATSQAGKRRSVKADTQPPPVTANMTPEERKAYWASLPNAGDYVREWKERHRQDNLTSENSSSNLNFQAAQGL